VRVLIVSEYYRPWPGGISEHVHHEAVELTKRGHEVQILTGPASRGHRDELNVVRFGPAWTFESNGARSRILWPALRRLRRAIHAFAPDVLHAHAPLDPTLALAAVRSAPCPSVGTFHASFQPGVLWDFLYRTLRPMTGPAFDRLHTRLAVSEEARGSIARYFPDSYRILSNGVDLVRFHPDQGSPDGVPTLLFVGRSDRRKGLPVLVAAYQRLRDSGRRARLRIVGVTPEQFEGCVPRVSATWAADIEVLGECSPEAMPRLVASSDLLCSPALGQESQGIVLLEAMASGVAPIASDIAGYRDVIRHGVDGLLVEPGSAEALAAACTALLDDPDRRARMGRAARERSLEFAWSRVGAQLEEVLREAATTGGRPGHVTPTSAGSDVAGRTSW
jgi:phosphatidylinositol alpha-mannosyltransferase